MNKSTDSQSGSQQGDSRLKEFLRRASPILAAERGWNERSQLKIKSLAEDLQLPDDLYDIAVTRLQQGNLEFDERFSKYEQSFIRYLHQQFSKSTTTVLTAAHETKAIRIARREYEIPQARARQLVRQVAEQLGVSRVSKLDAVEYVAGIVDEQIGDNTFVPDSVRGRIYQASRKWGVDRKQVEILIDNRIAANRQVAVPDHPKGVRLVAAVIALLVILAMFWAIQKFVVGTLGDIEPNPPATGSKEETTGGTSVSQSLPRWWASETAEHFRSFAADNRAARFPHELLKSDRDGDRLAGYESIAQLIRENRGDFCQQCIRMFALFFADESFAVCQRMSPLISEFGEMQTGPLPQNTRRFQDIYRAADMIAACLEFPVTVNKEALLDEIAFQVTGQSIYPPSTTRRDGDWFRKTHRQTIAKRQWRYLHSASFSQPEQAANLIDQLGDLTREEGILQHPDEYSTAFHLLSIRPGVWTSMRRTLQRAIDQASEDQLRELYLQKNESSIPELQSWMGKRLAQRLEIGTDRLTARRIDEAIEAKLNLATSRAGALRPRWQRLHDHAPVQRLIRDELAATPANIGLAVHYTTIAILIDLAEKSGDQGIVARADGLFEETPRNLAVRSSPVSANLPVYRRIQRRALPSDIRAFNEAIEKLQDSRSNADRVNARAFEQLARAAPGIRDVTHEQALMLAAYILEASETSELVAIEKYCSQMRHWPNLALALADQLIQTEGSVDQALTSTSILFGFQPQIDQQDWRKALRIQVLHRVAEGLRHTAEVQGHDERYQWNELRSLLMTHYRLRCVAVGLPGARVSAALNPAELTGMLAEALSPDSLEQTRRKLLSNQYIAQNEMQLFALHGRVLCTLNGMIDEGKRENDNIGTAIMENEICILKSLLRNEP